MEKKGEAKMLEPDKSSPKEDTQPVQSSVKPNRSFYPYSMSFSAIVLSESEYILCGVLSM